MALTNCWPGRGDSDPVVAAVPVDEAADALAHRGLRLEVESEGAIPLETIMREGVLGRPDVSALASLDKNKLCVMLWHYHDDDVPGPDANIELMLDELPSGFKQCTLRHYRVDQEHSNAYTVWKRMDKPQNPTPQQYADLEKAGQLAMLMSPERINTENGSLNLHIKLPRQAVSLLVIEWDD